MNELDSYKNIATMLWFLTIYDTLLSIKMGKKTITMLKTALAILNLFLPLHLEWCLSAQASDSGKR